VTMRRETVGLHGSPTVFSGGSSTSIE
jgi:hypothetical protein